MTAHLEHISGRVWRLGDHVNTDLLHPPSFFSLDPDRVKAGLQEGMDRLGTKVRGNSSDDGLVIVAGENFGCGSSRETSVRALAASGVRAVVARSFARIFFRSLANHGIPPLLCPGIGDGIKHSDGIRLFPKAGFLELIKGSRFPLLPMDPHIEKILRSGGLISYLRGEIHGL